ERRAANPTEGSLGEQARGDRACVLDSGIALMVEELYGKVGIDCSLVRIRERTIHLIQAEAGEQVGLVGDAVIDSNRELVGPRRYLGRSGVSAFAVGARRIVGQRIACQQGNDRWMYRHCQSVVRKCDRINSLPLGFGRHGKDLGCAKNLAKALILAEVVGAIASVVDFWQYDRATIRKAEFIANKWWNTAWIGGALVIEVVRGVEGGIAHKFKNAAMDLVAARLGDHIRIAGGAVADFRRHYPRAGLNLLNRVNVEVRKGSAAHLGIGSVEPIHGEDCG